MRFERFDLRTTAPAAAARFYAEVADVRVEEGADGLALSDGRGARLARVVSLPERARAQGAPSHWLGHLGATDGAFDHGRRLCARGAAYLGPAPSRGATTVLLRDPFGAVVALVDGGGDPARGVVWHELHTADLERAWSWYAAACGWRRAGDHDLGAFGTYRTFTWDEGPAIGGLAESARQPGIHPHWLFYLPVADLGAALDATRRLGGRVGGGPRRGLGDRRIAHCEDPQGAAFALSGPLA